MILVTAMSAHIGGYFAHPALTRLSDWASSGLGPRTPPSVGIAAVLPEPGRGAGRAVPPDGA